MESPTLLREMVRQLRTMEFDWSPVDMSDPASLAAKAVNKLVYYGLGEARSRFKVTTDQVDLPGFSGSIRHYGPLLPSHRLDGADSRYDRIYEHFPSVWYGDDGKLKCRPVVQSRIAEICITDSGENVRLGIEPLGKDAAIEFLNSVLLIKARSGSLASDAKVEIGSIEQAKPAVAEPPKGDPPWKILRTSDAAKALNISAKAIQNEWIKKHPERIRREKHGWYQVNPEYIVDPEYL